MHLLSVYAIMVTFLWYSWVGSNVFVVRICGNLHFLMAQLNRLICIFVVRLCDIEHILMAELGRVI